MRAQKKKNKNDSSFFFFSFHSFSAFPFSRQFNINLSISAFSLFFSFFVEFYSESNRKIVDCPCPSVFLPACSPVPVHLWMEENELNPIFRSHTNTHTRHQFFKTFVSASWPSRSPRGLFSDLALLSLVLLCTLNKSAFILILWLCT